MYNSLTKTGKNSVSALRQMGQNACWTLCDLSNYMPCKCHSTSNISKKDQTDGTTPDQGITLVAVNAATGW